MVKTFRRGETTFKCEDCGHLTRETGVQCGIKLCPDCYDLAGLVNQFSDDGKLDTYTQELVLELISAIEKKGGTVAPEYRRLAAEACTRVDPVAKPLIREQANDRLVTKSPSKKQQVLDLITNNDGITADTMASILGVSRNSVRGHVEVLRVKDNQPIRYTLSDRKAVYYIAK